MVFTDGSVCSGTVGCGACAAVVIPLGEGVVVTDSKAVAMKTNSVACEFEGVLLGIKLNLDFFRVAGYRRSRECAYIFSDCAYVIESVINRNCIREHSELFEKLVSLEEELTMMNIDAFLVWIPGHSGIQCNNMVDSIAKDTAH